MKNKKTEAARVQESLLAPMEKRLLIWIAERLPRSIQPDHLTLLGLGSMLLAGIAYVVSAESAAALYLASFALFLNWFGDSLDGTLARVRNQQRPRYGFYVDHLIDSFGALFLIVGMMLGGILTQWVAMALLVAYLLLSINSYLAAYSLGVFQISFGKFSPTELRILLMVGNWVLLWKPIVHVLDVPYRLFDVGAVVATVAIVVVLLYSTLRNTYTLYQLERV